MEIDDDRLIRLPLDHAKANYLAGFWRWVDRLAADDDAGAIEGLHWPRGADRTPEGLKHQVTTFFGGDDPWSVVVPNDRLVGVIDDAAEFDPPDADGRGWFRAMVPSLSPFEGGAVGGGSDPSRVSGGPGSRRARGLRTLAVDFLRAR